MDVYSLAQQYALQTNRCIYVTGKAGTGKTTFLRNLRQTCGKQMAVVAATGVAAINAEGVTIHSFFQLPPQTFLPTPAARRKLFAEMQMREAKRKVLRNLELLVIDEISMVRADLLDAMDAVLRHIKHYPQLPFGGVQVIFIGDLFQLSPVVREEDWQRLRAYYTGPYFFQAQVMRELNPVYLEFDHIFRQQNTDFIRILNEVRDNTLSPQSLTLLNSRYQPNYVPDDTSIILSTHNHKVNSINERELNKLSTPVIHYAATIEGNFPENAYPANTDLQLKEGARVMFIKNDTRPEKAFYNGKLGTITKLTDEEIWVNDDDGNEIEVPRVQWENVRYTTNEKNDTLDTEVIGTFTQYPLRLAWAVTIHKAQGLTFDRVVIDAADAFAAGQVYVALSRCRTLEGITLLSPVPNAALGGDPEVIRYTQAQPPVEAMLAQLSASEKAYFTALLCSIFDFRQCFYATERLQGIIQSSKERAEQAGQFVRERLGEVAEWQSISERFQRQIMEIMEKVEKLGGLEVKKSHGDGASQSELQSRLQSATAYFSPRMEQMRQAWTDLAIDIDAKEDSKNYKETLTELLTTLSLTQHLMQKMSEETSLKAYFAARQSFVAPKISISTDSSERASECQHPILLQRLILLRKTMASDSGVPAFWFAKTTLLGHIANTLPTTKQELQAIKSFGKKKYQLWGEEMLRVIRQYCQEQNLPLHETPQETPTENKARRKKGESAFRSFQYFEQGLDIADIAKERNLSPNTIADHLWQFIDQHIISLDDFSMDDYDVMVEYAERYRRDEK